MSGGATAVRPNASKRVHDSNTARTDNSVKQAMLRWQSFGYSRKQGEHDIARRSAMARGPVGAHSLASTTPE